MCIFCKIANNEIPSYKIYEDEMCLAFLDLSQANIGHTLVIPKQHYDNILDIDSETTKHIFNVVSMLTKHLNQKLNISDFNILNNCGVNAGQTINHFHVHIIPRHKNDNIVMQFSENKLSEDDFKDLQNKLYIKTGE